MKYLYLIILIIMLSSGCIDDSEYELREEHRKFIIEMKEEYDKENVSKPYSEIQVVAVQQYDNYISVNGTVEIYNQSGYPFTPITKIDVEYGVGNIEFDERNYSVFTHTDYHTAFNGQLEFYDMWYMNKEYTPLPHHVMSGVSIPVQLLFEDIVKVGYFEPQEHQLINLNNQSSFEFDICILDPHGAIKNPVLCFVNDWYSPFEGDEFKKHRGSTDNTPPVTLTRLSGSDFNAKYDITDIVNDAGWTDACVLLGPRIDENNNRWIYGGYCGRYQIDFNHIRYDHLISGKDIMYVYLDDMDEYLGKDILRSTKAKSVHIATIIAG